MNRIDRLERELSAWFVETAAPRTPPYLTDILRQTAILKQRPRWTLVERLIPMTTTTSFRAVTSSVPWRTIGLIVLLLITLLVGAALVGSGLEPRLPGPFGPARAGLIAYSNDGDIFVVDPGTNTRRSIVSTHDTDRDPQWSRDGTRIVFERLDGSLSQLFTVRPDGSDLTLITPSPISLFRPLTGRDYAFSPDGRSVLFLSQSAIQIARTDGSGVTAISMPNAALEATWRPPGGAEVAALGTDASIYLLSVTDGTIETILPPFDGMEGGGLAWSPDGTAIAYGRWNDSTATTFTVRSHVLDIATGHERLVDTAGDDAFWDALPTWSNDGRRLALIRGYVDGYADVTAAIVNADGSGARVETAHSLGLAQECCAVLEWAPDDSSVLWMPVDAAVTPLPQLLIDPDTGAVAAAPWHAASDPAWQRLAP